MLLAVVLGGVLFAGSYGVGRAGEGGKSEPLPAASPRATVPEIGGLEAAKPLPKLAGRPRRRKASGPASRVTTQPQPEPEPQPEPTPVPAPVTPARPAPAPKPTPAPTPTPPAPGGGFDDSG